jgi:hypothetical protein
VSVHIGELHSEVTTSSAASGSDGHDPGRAGDSTEEREREARRRADWLEQRVAAEGFDD